MSETGCLHLSLSECGLESRAGSRKEKKKSRVTFTMEKGGGRNVFKRPNNEAGRELNNTD